MTAIEQLRLLLGLSSDGVDDLLTLVIDEVNAYICAYCRREDVPAPIAKLVPAMACALWRSRGYGTADAPKVIKSISQGNRSVTYADTSADAYSDVFAPYRIMLNPYRRALTPEGVSEYEGLTDDG